eukprot:6362802-Heterocapsa_arctica.AAC.1
MPCPPVVPRRKPKFVDVARGDIEEYPVDVVFRNNGYAIYQVRDKPPRTVVRVDGGNNITDWTSYAIARYRAIELANGDGLLSDPTDVEPWRGVDLVHPKECRRPPLIWESDA